MLPVSSVVQVQFAMAPGTAIVQKRLGGDSITIAICGDAGTAEGDFASCMIWATRPGNELPVLMIVMNNQWGISTRTDSQFCFQNIADRGEAFGIPSETFDGNDPVVSWCAIDRAMQWCREKRRPFLIEPRVSRLHGHSSSSGAKRVSDEPDCIELFEKKLLDASVLSQEWIDETWQAARAEALQASKQALNEPQPTPDDVYRHTYAPSSVDVIYPDDYRGLPE